MMKKKLERLQSDEAHIEDSNAMNDYRIQSGADHLSNIKETHDFEKMNQWVYKHMIGRMKADLIATQISANELHEAFKQKQIVCDEETEKNRQAKQRRLQAQHKLEDLMNMIEEEHRQRNERVRTLSNSAKNKQEAIDRRLARVARQQEISEAAANENKDSNVVFENLIASLSLGT